MYPQGFFGIDWFRVIIPIVAIGGTVFAALYLRREKVPAEKLFWLQVCIGLLALFGAKLFSLYVRDWQAFTPLSQELRGGWRYPGAMLAIILVGPLCKKWLLPELPLSRYLDVLAITICFGYAALRVSCFLNGCCVGGMCEAEYCLSYPPGSAAWYTQMNLGLLEHSRNPSHPVLPLHLLFMAASLAIGAFLIWFDRRRQYNGQVALLFLVLHESAKAMLETLREPFIAELLYTSLLIALAGAMLLSFLYLFKRGELSTTNKT